MFEDQAKQKLIDLGFTKRQAELTLYAYSGMTNKQIARLMHIQHSTVNYHLFYIFHKLNVKSRFELIPKVQNLLSKS